MKELFLQNGHLSDDGIRALIGGTLDEMQRMEAAEHLSFCDECLLRYTDLLGEEVLEEPTQDLTLPVMRRIRQRALKIVTKRHAAAVAAVVVTAGLWYTGIFGGAMDALAVQPERITAPAAQQTKQEDALSELMKAMNSLMFPEPQRMERQLGPENRPQSMDALSEQNGPQQNQPSENEKTWFNKLFHKE